MKTESKKSSFFQIMIISFFICFLNSLLFSQTESILFEENFENGTLDGWNLSEDDGGSWELVNEGGNYVLCGKDHNFASPNLSGWRDYNLELSLKIIMGDLHLYVRSANIYSYLFGISKNEISLSKRIGEPIYPLTKTPEGKIDLPLNTWLRFRIELKDTNIKLFVNGQLEIEYSDTDNPSTFGKFAFECLNGTFYFDDILVTGETLNVITKPWIRTGGPIGGLGYDIRIHPDDKNIMFVTDNPSGLYKSYDKGFSWLRKNNGIDVVSGTTGDATPVFCVTIDPKNHDIVWAGFQNSKGAYKSINGGETWIKKTNGIIESEITVRGFGVNPLNNNIVYAGCEINTGIQGKEFARVRGKIYKTIDGGENWFTCWEGDNLARFILVDPRNPDILYASTGIFDREPANDRGIGILKSTDGGQTWQTINNGLTNYFVGFLDMHPLNPDILIAAAGMNQEREYGFTDGGVFITYNGGEKWENILSDWIMTVATFSPQNPQTMYAANDIAFYKSKDGGKNWIKYQKESDGTWGPEGMSPGFPISIVVDPDDEDIVFVNNYAGGNLRTTDGGKTWESASRGYTGADVRSVAINPIEPNIVYARANTGIFRSVNGGLDWKGISNVGRLGGAGFTRIVVNPHSPNQIWAGVGELPRLYKSEDQGGNWIEVFRIPEGEGFIIRDCAISNSHPEIMYVAIDNGFYAFIDYGEKTGFGVYRSDDGGINWRSVNNGLEETNKEIRAIAIHPQIPNIAYIGTHKHGLFKTTNGGQNWTSLNSGLSNEITVNDITINPEYPEIIYIGVERGSIYKSVDDGNNWLFSSIGMSPNSNIESIVIDKTNPANIYAADSYSGVFQSMDHGETWYLINKGLEVKAVQDLSISDDGKVIYAGTNGGGVYKMTLENYRPIITSIYPDTSRQIQIWQDQTQIFSINAYDFNNEGLQYSWFLDNFKILNETSPSYTQIGIDTLVGIHDLKIEVSDSINITTVSWKIKIAANTAPSILDLPDFIFNEDDTLVVDLNKYVTDSEHDSSQLDWEYNIYPLTDDFVVYLDSWNHKLIIIPARNWFGGPFNLILTVTDQGGKSDVDTTFFEVLPVNDPPLLFELMFPSNGTTINSDSVLFNWHSTSDIDVGDSLRYIFYLSSNQKFDPLIFTANLIDSTLYYTEKLDSSSTYFWKVEAVDLAGSTTTCKEIFNFHTEISTLISTNENFIPKEFFINQNYPNPFNPSTTIKFGVKEACWVKLTVHNLLGQIIKELVSEPYQPGYYSIQFEASDLASGVYFLYIKMGNFRETKKIIVLR